VQTDLFLKVGDQITLVTALPIILLFLFFGLDDFFVDICAWIFRLRPLEITADELKEIYLLPEKKIAILVAAWKEDGVLKQMIRGNLATIQYQNYAFFLGVYPNDLGTLQEAQEIASRHPNVHVVINPLEGPTCKGQMLNVMVRTILQNEKRGEPAYDVFIIHDSEDLIHRHEFKVVNRDLEKHDFIQVPVFSLPVSALALVAGVYIDEFAESHTKSVLVRNYLGAPIPSAGVGTALSRRLVQACLDRQGGHLLNPRSLTEDYELGLSTDSLGFSSQFSCYYVKAENRRKDFIATREYFPKSFQASVRQKSRWTLGIAFQGFENLGWKGSLIHRYFLFRDRKGPFCNTLVIIAFFPFVYALTRELTDPHFIMEYVHEAQLPFLIELNLFLMLNRITQRMWAVKRVYNWKLTLFSPLRWPLANLINFLATYRAIQQYAASKISGTEPKWIKTEHELPIGFGDPEVIKG
jgi:adsorption protein B